MLHTHQQKKSKCYLCCVGEKKDEKKNVTRGPNLPCPISTRGLNGMGYAG